MSAWTDAELAEDKDLTAFESLMPNQAQKIRSEAGATAYDGKRAIAKDTIGRWLSRRGYNLDGLTVPAEFGRAAVLLELSLIYRDMARRNESVAADKANFYASEYGEEIEGLQFTYDPPSTPSTPKERSSAILWRG